VRYYPRTKQYSITALTDLSAGTVERYAYDAYGELSIFDASGTARLTTRPHGKSPKSTFITNCPFTRGSTERSLDRKERVFTAGSHGYADAWNDESPQKK